MLTPRQTQILELLWDGLNVKEVAETLGVSDKSVYDYIARIQHKTGFKSYIRLVRWALENGVIPVPTKMLFQIRSMGGKAHFRKLSPEQRSEWARRANAVRWGPMRKILTRATNGSGQ